MITGKRANAALVPNVGGQPQMTDTLPTEAAKVLEENAVNWMRLIQPMLVFAATLKGFWTLISEHRA
jgi:hypothetical protein